MVASAFTIGAGASSAYQTYTYSINGDALYSPDAYSATGTYDYLAMGLDTNLDNPGDMVTDAKGKVYLADTNNNRIVILNKYYAVIGIIDGFVDKILSNLNEKYGATLRA